MRNYKWLHIYQKYIAVAILIATVGTIALLSILWSYNVAIGTELKRNKELLSTTNNDLVATQERLQAEVLKNNNLSQELEDVQTIISDLKNTEYKAIYYNDFKITHYCNELYDHICGGNGVTASGTTIEVGRTVAVDPSVIPYGTILYIEGYGFRVAEDCGGAVKEHQIDVAVHTHDEAMSSGVRYNVGVWVLLPRNN